MPRTQLPTAPDQQLYETDFVLWIAQTAELLKQGRFDALDLEHLIEEVESLGRSEKNAIKGNLHVLLMHLLKWQYQGQKRTSRWRSTINEHRNRLHILMESSPSLRNYYRDVFDSRYPRAREFAADETGLDLSLFPDECPYTAEQVLDTTFWPEADGSV